MILKIVTKECSVNCQYVLYEAYSIEIKRMKTKEALDKVNDYHPVENKNKIQHEKHNNYSYLAIINNNQCDHVLRIAFDKAYLLNNDGKTVDHFLY